MGERHVGTLDLSGEGNRASPISDEATEAMAQRMHAFAYPGAPWDLLSEESRDWCRRNARAALEAAYPAIREQVAEEIAVALEAVPAEVYPEDSFPVDGTSVDCQSARVMRFAYPAAARMARDIGGRGAEAVSAGVLGAATGLTGGSASPSDPPAGKTGRGE